MSRLSREFKAYRLPPKFAEIWPACLFSSVLTGLINAILMLGFYSFFLDGETVSTGTQTTYLFAILTTTLIGFSLGTRLFMDNVRGISRFVPAFIAVGLCVVALYLIVQLVAGTPTPFMKSAIEAFGLGAGILIGSAVLCVVVVLLSILTAYMCRTFTILFIRVKRYRTLTPPSLEAVKDFYTKHKDSW